MRNRIEETMGDMPRFWEPRPSRFWQWLMTPLHRHFLHRHHGIAEVRIEGMERLAALDPNDGVLLCPNHSYTGDGSVMMDVGRRSPRLFHIMAAWHVFRGHGGIDGFCLQRMGCFSVDREGCDRRAIRTAIELLSSGQALVVFPEGEIYHLNEKLTPLREGVAFMAVSAQRDLEKQQSPARVWLVPTAIRYQFCGDVTPALERAMTALEQRVVLKLMPGAPLPERIVRFGEMMLTLKEKEQLGRSYDDDGETIPGRVARLMHGVLDRLEQQHLGKSNADEPVPVRVKLLRQNLLEKLESCAPGASSTDATTPLSPPADPHQIRDALNDVHLVLQLYS